MRSARTRFSLQHFRRVTMLVLSFLARSISSLTNFSPLQSRKHWYKRSVLLLPESKIINIYFLYFREVRRQPNRATKRWATLLLVGSLRRKVFFVLVKWFITKPERRSLPSITPSQRKWWGWKLINLVAINFINLYYYSPTGIRHPDWKTCQG